MADVDSLPLLADLDDEHPAFEFGARTLAETQLLAAGLVPSVMKAQANGDAGIR